MSRRLHGRRCYGRPIIPLVDEHNPSAKAIDLQRAQLVAPLQNSQLRQSAQNCATTELFSAEPK